MLMLYLNETIKVLQLQKQANQRKSNGAIVISAIVIKISKTLSA